VTIIAVATNQGPEFQFDLSGGQLALDLANTVSRRDNPERRKDHLLTYFDLLAFARQSQVVDAKLAQELSAYTSGHAAEARRSLQKTVALREAVYRAFARIAQGQAAEARDLQTITDETGAALRNRVLVPQDGGYAWQWTTAGNLLERPLWPMALA